MGGWGWALAARPLPAPRTARGERSHSRGPAARDEKHGKTHANTKTVFNRVVRSHSPGHFAKFCVRSAEISFGPLASRYTFF